MKKFMIVFAVLIVAIGGTYAYKKTSKNVINSTLYASPISETTVNNEIQSTNTALTNVGNYVLSGFENLVYQSPETKTQFATMNHVKLNVFDNATKSYKETSVSTPVDGAKLENVYLENSGQYTKINKSIEKIGTQIDALKKAGKDTDNLTKEYNNLVTLRNDLLNPQGNFFNYRGKIYNLESSI